jgi:dTDP-4-amino-4,6-dideoxygalactose transaminase
MAALHLAYLQFGIGPGDEVIVPAMTHIATVHAVEWVGAKPVFVDCDPNTGNVTPAVIAAAISPRTKAVSVVHFQGIPCDMPGIVKLAEQHGLKVIEDCALAVGTHWSGRHAGLFGDAACFSFYPVKHLTTGEGGMFVTRHADVAAAVARLRAFGVDRRHDQRAVPGMYDVPTLGLNYRMSEMQAALGRSQLRRVETILARRRENFEQLKQGLELLADVRVLDVDSPHAVSGHYGLSLMLEDELKHHRDDFIRRLNEQGVGTSVYYPQPVPRMAYYQEKYGYDRRRYSVAADISDHSIALPVGPHIDADDSAYIINRIIDTLTEEIS